MSDAINHFEDVSQPIIENKKFNQTNKIFRKSK